MIKEKGDHLWQHIGGRGTSISLMKDNRLMSWPHKIFLGQVSDFELRLLRIFQVVVECQGFTAAENELGITRSTISRHICDLETRLGARLCSRGRGGFALTPEGQSVFNAATQLFSAVEEFRSTVNELHLELAGEIHIGFIDTLVTMDEMGMQSAISRFSKLHPNVQLKIVVGTADEIVRAVQDRRLHIGVTVKQGRAPRIVEIPLATEVSYLYCGPGHEAFDCPESEIDLASVSRFRMVRHAYSEAEGQAISRWNLSVASSANQTEGILLLVLGGSYVGFVPGHFARTWEDKGLLRRLLPATLTTVSTITAIVHKNARQDPMVSQFLSLLPVNQAVPQPKIETAAE
ncbi:MAG: LysR family transcriptional regulator [Pseudomonadota bacterium]